ncbi:MAG: Crp/Fnr family transcriptional regulator [Mycobacteriales bacterium]
MIRRLTDQVADEALLDLPGRVAKTLLRLVDDQVAGERDGQPVVALSQSKLADLAGGSRQSVNTALSTMASRGLLRVEARKIVITDLDGLRAKAGGNLDAAASPSAQARASAGESRRSRVWRAASTSPERACARASQIV